MPGRPRAGAQCGLGASAPPSARNEAEDGGLTRLGREPPCPTGSGGGRSRAMHQLRSPLRFIALGCLLALPSTLGCQKTDPEPESRPAAETKPDPTPAQTPTPV